MVNHVGPCGFVLALGLASAGCSSTPDACDQRIPGTVCELAGTGETKFNRDGLPATATALYLPSAVRRGPDGLVYIMDYNNQRIRRIEHDDTISTIAGNGDHAFATEGAIATESPLENPIDFDFLPDGRLIFVSYHDPRLLMIDTDGTLQLVAGNVVPGNLGNEGDGQDPRSGRFVSPAGIEVAPDGTIYISDDMANRVRVIRNGTIDTLAGTGRPLHAGDGGLATAADLLEPTAIAIDAAGNVLIAESGNSAIRAVTPDGMISTVAGIGESGTAGDDGPATSAQLADPEGLAVAADGTWFIGERASARIRRVATDGTISTVAGTGTRGMSGDAGPALEADFGAITRIVMDIDGSLLVADQTNSRIRKIITPP